MAKKREPKVPATAEKHAVRLELSTAVHEMLAKEGDKMDRSLSYVARMAVTEWLQSRQKGGHKTLPGQASFLPPAKKGGGK